MSRVLMIAGGGTGGHIYPAIAIAQEFVSRGEGRNVIFVGTARGLETTIVPKAGFPLELISVGGLQGKGPLELLRNLARLPVGFFQAWGLLGRHRPGVVLGVGGYASGPILAVARLRGIPTAIHEQNAYPGLTNRILARFVQTVAVAFPGALPRLNRADGVVTGNPVRKEFFTAAASRIAGSDSDRTRLLIFGGSQGSKTINDAMTGALLFLSRLKGRLEIVHQTGPKELEHVREAYRTSAFADTRVVPYLDPISGEIAAADLVVCRAGAMTIGELAAVGRPSILIPFAAATNNHQEENARAVESAGGAVVITEAQLTPERLGNTIAEIAGDPQRARTMGSGALNLAAPDATRKIVDLLEKIDRSE